MRAFKFAIQLLFYGFILAFLVSSSAAAPISHDEGQFIAAAQVLVEHGRLPYVGYPYTHMPYAIAFYAAVVALTPYDYLAARLLTSVVWLLSLFALVALARTIRGRPAFLSADPPSIPELLWEFALVIAFVFHPVIANILGFALNHSFPTLFSLLALLFFVRSLRPEAFSYRDPFLSGVFVSLAACTRLNFASLVLVLLILWILPSRLFLAGGTLKTLARYIGGVLLAAVPGLLLLAIAPLRFYYTNLVFPRLDAAYFQGLLFDSGMDLSSKFMAFASTLLQRPIDWILYAALICFAILSLVRLVRRRSPWDLGLFATAGFAFVLWLTAFAPTPGLPQYFFAPLPFLLLLLEWSLLELRRFGPRLYLPAAAAVLFLLSANTPPPDPSNMLGVLGRPSSWTPVEAHDFAISLTQYVPAGPVLTLTPVLPLEAGYDVYPFTINGPFIWRTSLLLSPQRRAAYGVVSPEELGAVLAEAPPAAILTGFEASNAGFELGDTGGLETPFMDYAIQHSYRRYDFKPAVYRHPVTLWVRP